MGQKQRYSKENYRIMPHVVAPRKSSKRKQNLFNCEIPIFKPSPKAESVEVLDKGPTTNVFTIYFFYYSSKTHRQSLVILRFCLQSLHWPAFKLKIFLSDMKILYCSWWAIQITTEKKLNWFLLSISKQISKTYFGKAITVIMAFIMAFISNFFQNRKAQHPTFIILAELAYISGK